MLRRMTDEQPRGADIAADLQDYLQRARTGMLSRLDGLGEYDIRRPLTPTGTNLLGLVKHSATSHARYFGEVFGRPQDTSLPWMATDAEPNADFWATPGEGRDDIVALARHSWAVADTTITELPLDAV